MRCYVGCVVIVATLGKRGSPVPRAKDVQEAKDFARRLQGAMIDKGWNQSDLARQAAKHMPNKNFGRDNVSKYLKGSSMPNPLRLAALSKALGAEPEALMPSVRGRLDAAMDAGTPFEMRAEGRNTAWVRVNQRVPLDVAMKIMNLLGSGA